MNGRVRIIGGMILTGENRSTGRATCHSENLSTKNPTWTGPGIENGPPLRANITGAYHEAMHTLGNLLSWNCKINFNIILLDA
jgi:hypothetical protein